jgi:hypothetical protein
MSRSLPHIEGSNLGKLSCAPYRCPTAIEFAGFLLSRKLKSLSIYIAGGKPRQPMGYGFMGWSASSLIIIDSPSSININFYPRSSGSPPAARGVLNVMFGMLDFHANDTGAILMLPVPATASLVVNSMSSSPVAALRMPAVESAPSPPTSYSDAPRVPESPSSSVGSSVLPRDRGSHRKVQQL